MIELATERDAVAWEPVTVGTRLYRVIVLKECSELTSLPHYTEQATLKEKPSSNLSWL